MITENWFVIIYVVSLIIIYFVSAFIEKKSPGTLKGKYDDDYNFLLGVSLFWPIMLIAGLVMGLFVMIILLISWPWRKIADPKAKFNWW